MKFPRWYSEYKSRTDRCHPPFGGNCGDVMIGMNYGDVLSLGGGEYYNEFRK
jgi:hypothetical protein